jgi:hypothetical protein
MPRPHALRAAAAAAAPRARPHALPHPRPHAHTHAHARPAHCLLLWLQVRFFPARDSASPVPRPAPRPTAAAPRASPGQRCSAWRCVPLSHSHTHTHTHAHATTCTRAPHSYCTAGDVAQLSELTAATAPQRDAFLRAVDSDLGGQPFEKSSFSGLDITRKEGDTLLTGDAVATVNKLINAAGSGIKASMAQSRGGACPRACPHRASAPPPPPPPPPPARAPTPFAAPLRSGGGRRGPGTRCCARRQRPLSHTRHTPHTHTLSRCLCRQERRFVTPARVSLRAPPLRPDCDAATAAPSALTRHTRHTPHAHTRPYTRSLSRRCVSCGAVRARAGLALALARACTLTHTRTHTHTHTHTHATRH